MLMVLLYLLVGFVVSIALLVYGYRKELPVGLLVILDSLTIALSRGKGKVVWFVTVTTFLWPVVLIGLAINHFTE